MNTLLEVSGVSVSFDGFKAINNLSIQIGEPELRAVIGPYGAGKTTFMDILTGKTKPDEGRVIWGERSVSLLGMSESQIAQEGIGRKFQKPTVFEAQTVHENIAKLSVVGVGMKTHSGVAANLFTALAKAEINIDLITTSEIKISVVVDQDRVDEAARVTHTAFGLDGGDFSTG